jgi:thiol-disulfide isomerase/thioredoxin
MKIFISSLALICIMVSVVISPAAYTKGSSYKPDSIPDFNLKDIKGYRFKLSSLQGKYVLLDFWASWCMPCIAAMPRVDSLNQQYGGDKFAIVSISIDKSNAAWLKELRKHHISWHNTIAADTKITQYFKIDAVPHTVLISPQGEIILTEEGLSSDSAIARKLKNILGKSKLIELVGK